MSYKFPIFRCDTCGVVAFDPPEGRERAALTDQWQEMPYPCRLLRASTEPDAGFPFTMPRFDTCAGQMRPFALEDADSFICLIDGWRG